MKQMKIVMFAVLAMISVGFTSCMKGEDSIPQGAGMAQVISGGMGAISFSQVGGFSVLPTFASLTAIENQMNFKTSSTKVAFIIYNFNYEGNEDYSNSGKIKNATMQYAVSLDSPVEEVAAPGASNDSVSTEPILGLENIMGEVTKDNAFAIWKDRFLVTGIKYYFQQKEHYFTLVYYEDEQVEGKLKLHLRHSGVVEKEGVGTTSWDAYLAGFPYRYMRAFDLRDILPASFTKGETTIEVIADVNTVNNKLDDKVNTQKKTYSIVYKAPTE